MIAVLRNIATICIPLGSVLAAFGVINWFLVGPIGPVKQREDSILTHGVLNSITPGQQVRDLGEVDPRRVNL